MAFWTGVGSLEPSSLCFGSYWSLLAVVYYVYELMLKLFHISLDNYFPKFTSDAIIIANLSDRDFLWEPLLGCKWGFKMEHFSWWLLWNAVQEGEHYLQDLGIFKSRVGIWHGKILLIWSRMQSHVAPRDKCGCSFFVVGYSMSSICIFLAIGIWLGV